MSENEQPRGKTEEEKYDFLQKFFSKMPHFQAQKKGQSVADLQKFVGQLRGQIKREKGPLYRELNKNLRLGKKGLSELVEAYLTKTFPSVDFAEREGNQETSSSELLSRYVSKSKFCQGSYILGNIPILPAVPTEKPIQSGSGSGVEIAVPEPEKVEMVKSILEENGLNYWLIQGSGRKKHEVASVSYQVFVFLDPEGWAKAVFVCGESNQATFVLQFKNFYRNCEWGPLIEMVVTNLKKNWKNKQELKNLTGSDLPPVEQLEVINSNEMKDKLAAAILENRTKKIEEAEQTDQAKQIQETPETEPKTTPFSLANPELKELEQLSVDLESFLQKVAEFQLVKEENLPILRKWLQEDQLVSVQGLGSMFFHYGEKYFEDIRKRFKYLFAQAYQRKECLYYLYSFRTLVDNESFRAIFLSLPANNQFDIVSLSKVAEIVFGLPEIKTRSHLFSLLQPYRSPINLRIQGQNYPVSGYYLPEIQEDAKDLNDPMFYLVNFVKDEQGRIHKTRVRGDKGVYHTIEIIIKEKADAEKEEKIVYLTCSYLIDIISSLEPKVGEIKQLLKDLGISLLLGEETGYGSAPNVIFAKDLWEKIEFAIGNIDLEHLPEEKKKEVVREFLPPRLKILRLRAKLKKIREIREVEEFRN